MDAKSFVKTQLECIYKNCNEIVHTYTQLDPGIEKPRDKNTFHLPPSIDRTDRPFSVYPEVCRRPTHTYILFYVFIIQHI
jgi:hypothetical protein